MSIAKAKETLLLVWTPNDISRAFGTEEKLDKHLEGWKDWIERFSEEDFTEAERAIRTDIVSECRGKDLDRPSLAAILQYCRVAKKNRELRENSRDGQAYTDEDKEAAQKALAKIKADLQC